MHSAAGSKSIRKIYWRSLDDMTSYYMDSLRGLTSFKSCLTEEQGTFPYPGGKADILNKNI